VAVPVSVIVFDQQCWHHEDVRKADLSQAVPVPGGWLSVGRRQHDNALFYWLKTVFLASAYSVAGASRDIILLDANGERELYREGPYNGITVNRAIRRLATELEQIGVNEFVRAKQLEDRQVGPVMRPSGDLHLSEYMLPYVYRLWHLPFRRRRKSG
jgi:hypothetical protein